ncbi:hypothetical protein, partial [Mesotoga prima]|uniref:hypothetical protein n=1 Tax=Mesotoga prima TaxID=1184387 RepID=UPI002FDA9D4F
MLRIPFFRSDETVALIDDVADELASTKRHLEAAGLKVLATSEEKGISNLIRQDTSALFLDARLENFNQSSIAVARNYAALNPGKPIFHISNFFGQTSHDKLQWKVSPLSPVYTVKKEELTSELLTEWVAEQLSKAAESLPTRMLGKFALDGPELGEEAR